MADLFSSAPGRHEPLAYRMRPRTLDEFAGQEHIVGKGRLLRRVIQADQLSSLIFYGPPGSGKTTLAQVIANTTKSRFITLNAVLSGVKELRESIEEAKQNRDLYARRTTLFVDEVHRWNKAQQDALLPWVENGTVILIGATTENPYFEVNRALVSRSRIFQLKGLEEEDLYAVARRALADPERGYGSYRVSITKEALTHLVRIANGDARSLLNALELAVETTPERFPPRSDEEIVITLPIAEESIQRKVVLYDKEGDYHFDTISAFIKSVRGSDADAALYWLARMVAAGEDPHFIFRRMLILASEDVGMADPRALPFVEAAAAAFDRVGLPEGRFHLAHAVIYLATAPKSNSTLGFFDALALVESEAAADEVPNHLRDASRDKEGFGHGEGYLYPHAFKDHWVAQQYLPSGLQGKLFYEPSDVGFEATIRAQAVRRREVQLATAVEPPSQEVLTFSPSSTGHWLERTGGRRGAQLSAIRDRLFSALSVRRHDRILVLEPRPGLLVGEAVRLTPEGGVWIAVASADDAALVTHLARELPETERPVPVLMELPLAETVRSLRKGEGGRAQPPLPGQFLAGFGLDEELRFEAIVGRNLLTRASASERRDAIALLASLLAPGGRIALAEVVPAMAQRLSALLDFGRAPNGLRQHFEDAEERAYTDPSNPLVAWGPDDLARAAAEAELAEVTATTDALGEKRRIGERELAAWLSAGSAYGRSLADSLSAEEQQQVAQLLSRQLLDRELDWTTTVALLVGKRS